MGARLKTVAAIAALLVLGLLALWGGTGTETADPQPAAGADATQAAGGRSTVPTRGGTDPESGLAWVELSSLPPEAQQTVRLIDRGGPFPYSRDGSRFGNRERLLPIRAADYYREYTVPTPGEDDRGARRIVTGDDDRELFWTQDHYASFARVRR